MDADDIEGVQPIQHGEEPPSPEAHTPPPPPVSPPGVVVNERYGWRITPIQEPTDGAAFEFQDLSRIQLQPIPIVQIDCWDPEIQQFIVPPPDELETLIITVAVQTSDGEDASFVRRRDDDTQAWSNLYGSLAQQAYLLPPMGHPELTGCYAFFPDLSIRLPGMYRLRTWITRVHMDPRGNLQPQGPYLDCYHTQNFDVFPLPQFVAPPQTDLTRHFADLGVELFQQDANWDLDHA